MTEKYGVGTADTAPENSAATNFLHRTTVLTNKHEETSSSVETFKTLNSIESFKNDEFFGDNNKKSKESESTETFNTLSTQNSKEFVDDHSNEDNTH